MDIVDAQVHVFHRMDPEACLFAMDSLGVQSVLIDEMWLVEPNLPFQPHQQLANGVKRALADGARMASMRYPDRFKYLRRVDYRDPDVETIVRFAGEDPHCLSLRVAVPPHQVGDLAAGEYKAVFKAAANAGMPLSVYTIGESPLLAPYAEELSDCRIIIDHVGRATSAEKFDDLLRLAKYPNITLKWCHAHKCFQSGDFPFQPLQIALKKAVEAFGRERIIWASDATQIDDDLTWAEVLFYVRECDLLSREDKEWILGRSARKIFAWPET